MRSDLTAPFIAAKNANFRRPRQLLVFHFPEAGDISISDQEIALGGRVYLPMVEDWGELSDSANQEDASGEIVQVTITLWNGGENPFSDYFLQEDPENVEVDQYQWFKGLTDSDKALIDRFVVQDPIEFDETSRLLRLDLVSIAMRYDGRIGPVLIADDWPFAKSSDVGKGIDLIVGSPGKVNTLCARTAPECLLNGSIIPGTMRIDIDVSDENLTELGFASSGKIQIDDEIMIFSSRTTSYFNISWRGVDDSDATNHSDGARVVQLIADHTYLVGQGPVSSITEVRVAGKAVPSSWFTAYPNMNPARIVFNRKPTYKEYLNSRVSNVYFDAWTGSNTARYPQHAFWKEHRSAGALLNNDSYKTLALVQNDPISDHGDLVNIFLNVTHWSTKFYTVEQVRVWVEGLGDIGALTRPNPDDELDLEGEVDIDHPHDHAAGAYHDHNMDQADYGTTLNDHKHAVDQDLMVDVVTGPNSGNDLQIGRVNTEGLPRRTWTYNYNWNTPPGYSSGDIYDIKLHLKIYVVRTTVTISESGHDIYTINEYPNGSRFVDIWLTNLGVVPETIYFSGYSDQINSYFRVDLCEVHIYYNKSASTTNNSSAANTYQAENANVHQKGGSSIKAADDVSDLATANRNLQLTKNEPATRSVTDSFDITDHLSSVDWSWFQGREVRLIYNTNGGTSGVYVVVTYMVFEVEYREKQTIMSDEITAKVTGSVDPSPEAVASYLLTNKAELPTTRIDSAVFAASRARYSSLGYSVDGVLSAGQTVRDALKKLCFQTRSRLIWTGGFAKMVLRENQANWSADKSILPADFQLRSINARRQRVNALINTITLLYGRDWTLGEGDEPFTESVDVKDPGSITQHGEKEDRDRWKMDLIASKTMADDVAAYYLDLLSTPSTFYEFSAYLDQFELEKEDKIELTSAGFNRMGKVPMVIRGIRRQFGSGKNKQINLIHVLAENLRYILKRVELSENVLVMDTLNAVVGKYIDLAEAIHTQDTVSAHVGGALEDTFGVEDALATAWMILEQIEEMVTFADEVSAALEVTIEDTVIPDDMFTVWRSIGFGSGEFGAIAFGGLRTWGQNNPDEVFPWDQLGSTMGALLDEDTVQISDIFVCNNGFGGSLGDGFGVTPFGQ